jgi:hypothetical protein
MDSSVYISGYISGPLQEQQCYDCELYNKKNVYCSFIWFISYELLDFASKSATKILVAAIKCDRFWKKWVSALSDSQQHIQERQKTNMGRKKNWFSFLLSQIHYNTKHQC